MKPILAKDHKGMMVCGSRILNQARGQGHAYMRREMAKHLEETAKRYYAGDISVCDEFFQLYCFGELERSAAKTKGTP